MIIGYSPIRHLLVSSSGKRREVIKKLRTLSTGLLRTVLLSGLMCFYSTSKWIGRQRLKISQTILEGASVNFVMKLIE